MLCKAKNTQSERISGLLRPKTHAHAAQRRSTMHKYKCQLWSFVFQCFPAIFVCIHMCVCVYVAHLEREVTFSL